MHFRNWYSEIFKMVPNIIGQPLFLQEKGYKFLTTLAKALSPFL